MTPFSAHITKRLPEAYRQRSNPVAVMDTKGGDYIVLPAQCVGLQAKVGAVKVETGERFIESQARRAAGDKK
jgi:hypothetical protein